MRWHLQAPDDQNHAMAMTMIVTMTMMMTMTMIVTKTMMVTKMSIGEVAPASIH